MLRLAPVAVEVIVGQLAALQLADQRIAPAGKLDGQAGGGLAGKELLSAVDRLCQPEPPAGWPDGERVTDLGLDLNPATIASLPEIMDWVMG